MLLSLVVFHVRKFLLIADYKTLCVALKLLPQLADHQSSLLQLHRRSVLSVTEPSAEQPPAQVPSGAFLMNYKHLVLPLPWAGIELRNALDVLDDLFCNVDRPAYQLVSINCILRTSASPKMLQTLRALLQTHAATLEVVSIVYEEGRTDFTPSSHSREPRSENTAPALPKTACTIDLSPDVLLDLSDLCMPRLTSLHLAVAFACRNFQCPKLANLRIYFMPEEMVASWCGKITEDASVFATQSSMIRTLVAASSPTLQDLHLSGCVRFREDCNVFDSDTLLYFPRLLSLDLGWACTRELQTVHELLMPQARVPIAMVLASAAAQQRALAACETAIDVTKTHVDLPPQMPVLRRIDFHGPVRMGLSNLHLKIHQIVNSRNPLHVGLHLSYRNLSATLEGILEFRLAFPAYSLFTVYADPLTKLHHFVLRRDFAPNRAFSSYVDFPSSHHRLNRMRVRELLKYSYVTPATFSRSKEPADAPPEVGDHMTGRDLFCLEMWQVPRLASKQDPPRNVYDIWNRDLDTSVKLKYAEMADLYKRRRYEQLRFEQCRPWWKVSGWSLN